MERDRWRDGEEKKGGSRAGVSKSHTRDLDSTHHKLKDRYKFSSLYPYKKVKLSPSRSLSLTFSLPNTQRLLTLVTCPLLFL